MNVGKIKVNKHTDHTLFLPLIIPECNVMKDIPTKYHVKLEERRTDDTLDMNI